MNKKLYYYIVYNSITYANRVNEMLDNQTGYSAVVHTPREISKGGCSYSIKATEDKFRKALKISQENNISVKGTFKETGKNRYTEVLT